MRFFTGESATEMRSPGHTRSIIHGLGPRCVPSFCGAQDPASHVAGHFENEAVSPAGIRRRLPDAISRVLLVLMFIFAAVPQEAPGAPGDLDAAYNPSPGNYVFCSAVQPDGKLVIGGDFGNVGATARSHLARLDANGAVDAGFNPGANNSVRSLAIQADGKIIVGGSFTTIAGGTRTMIARLNADGTLDAAFNPNITGAGTISDGVLALALQSDGKIVVGGVFTAVGGVTRNNVARLNADGTLDAAFNPNANNWVTCVSVRADGKIHIGGLFTGVGASSGGSLALLNADGTVSSIYGVNSSVWSLAAQADGKMVFGGTFSAVGATARNRLARLNADGSLDALFNPNVSLPNFTNTDVQGILIQTNGAMVICGNFNTVGGVTHKSIARLNPDGTLDAAFNPIVTSDIGGGLLQADGRIVLLGVGSVGGVTRNWLARLLNDSTTESLTAASAFRVQWLRGGASPEAVAVTFEQSTDGGGNWTALGAGTRITGGWEKTGLSLPASGSVRARARTAGGNDNGSPGLVETVLSFNVTGPMSGTVLVGPTGDFTTIAAAISDIRTRGLSGPLVLELQPTYVSSVETFPLLFSSLGTTAANTVTLRPAAGATALAISSADTTAATVDLNGAQFLTIDGRPGGVGTVSQLSIANTNVAGVALRFINEAGSNTVRYVALKGVNTSAASGVTVFSTTTGANGNDNNTIDHCDIRDGASTPANGIYALGTTATAAQNNSGNTVSNCNLFNFYAATAVDSAGVRLDGGNTDWTITGNSFYQTVNRAAVAASVRPIYVNNTSGNNFVVTGNAVGGTTPNAGGTAWTATGTTAAYLFVGIHLNAGATTPSSVQGNTVRNIVWTTSSFTNFAPGIWSGIYVQAGAVDIGTTAGNIIGNGVGTGSISVTTSTSGGTTFGIISGGTTTVANNIVGSITTNNPGSFAAAPLIGIQVAGGTATISGNTVGSTINANSLNAAASTPNQQLIGILSSGSGSATISGNTVANLNNNTVGTFGFEHVWGIAATDGVNTITGNTVRNLSTTSPNTSTALGLSLCGILLQSSLAGQTVSQNTVHSLSNTAPTAGVIGTGIYFDGAVGSHVISRNLVHSISLASSSGSLRGIEIAGGATVQNNMVRVGIGASGASTAGASEVIGIRDRLLGVRKYYHNSVYVGGTATSGSANTFALQGTSADFRNNIFVNARTNSGGTGKHYAVTYAGTTPNPAGLTASNNILFSSGTGGVLGLYNSTDQTTLAAWQSATGVDAQSVNADPRFANPTGDATAIDLHLQPNNPEEGQGTLIAAVVDDYDGQTRSSLTPTDIGADAGNFNWIDVIAPVITYTPLAASASTASRVLTGFATIADNFDVAGGASAPRLYYKKSTDADVFGVANNSAGNGWKYVTASNGTSPYGFTIDYSLVSGGGVSLNDVIQYFVVAQDTSNNLGSGPAGGFGAAANPPVQNINSHGAVNSYSILVSPSGTRSIGPTGDYRSITDAISAIQGIGLTGPLVLELQPAYVSSIETFPLVFSSLGTTAANTVTLRPASGATGLVISSADVTAATVDLNGAQFVMIDGRPGGVGSNAGSGGGTASQLIIANTSANGVSLRFINEAGGNTIQYTTLRSVNNSTVNGTVVFSTTTGANGNDNNTMDHCDLGDGASTPRRGIYASGSTGTTVQNNSGNTVSNCNIFNFAFSESGAGVWIVSGNTDWTLTGNSFYQTATRVAAPATVNAILINNTSGNNFTVMGNFIGGSAPNAGGTAWTTTGTASAYQFQGICLNIGTTTPSSVQGNVIANIVWTSSSNASTLPGVWSGIYVQAGSVDIGTTTGNTIGSGIGTGSVSVTTSGSGGTTFGIGSAGSGTIAIANNTIGSITMTGSASISGSLTGIQVIAGANTISNNVIGSTATANSLNAAASSASATGQQVTGILSSSSAGTSINGNTVANLNNSYAGTATAGQIRGIVVSNGVNTLTGNTVRNLSTTSANAGVTTQAAVLGISQSSATSVQTMSQNIVHTVANTAAAANVSVIGIYFTGPTSGTNVAARNLVHSLAVSSTGTTSALIGMQFAAGTLTAQNNIVRVGIDAAGNSTAGASTVRGIYDNGTTAGRNFYHNSVYVGGTQTSGAGSTGAFDGSTGVSNARTYRNNLFVNARGNGGGSGKHYAVNYGGTTVNPAGLLASNNLIFASGTGGVLGLYNGADRTSLAAWQAATGQDAVSLNASPLFVNPTGDATAVDLHVQTASPGSNAGAALAAVTNDFDAQVRSATVPDIGADEFNSPNANLTALTSSSGTLTPGFDANTTGYAATVANAVTALTVTPTAADAGATIAVNTVAVASGSASGAIDLNVGGNTITVLVTAQDLGAKMYTLTVTRLSLFQEWAAANGVPANNTNLLLFSFGMTPGGGGALVFNGTFGAGGTIGATGMPVTWLESIADGLDVRMLYVRRKDAAAAGLAYDAEFSATPGSWVTSAVTPTLLADDGTHQIVSVPYPAFIEGEPARFSRVRVTLSP
jgi:uncharacterized delta-60 repeat protein